MPINIQNLSKTYANGVQALKNIQLNINDGDFFALLGANGAGKTTLIGIITGLVNKTDGKIEVNELNLDTDAQKIRALIGVVPQEFNFNIFETPLDIVLNQAGYYGIPRKKAFDRANMLLEKLGLTDKKNVQSQTLSGGMKRRLMIARALIHNPKILILDEPTAGVDVELRAGMWSYLQELNQTGTTILLTTHYLEEVEQLCNKAAIIKGGEIIKNDLVKNLLNSLEKETYKIELQPNSNFSDKLANNPHFITVIDSLTLEVVITKSNTLQTVISYLSNQNILISGIRPKGNRLEDLFLSIVHNQ